MFQQTRIDDKDTRIIANLIWHQKAKLKVDDDADFMEIRDVHHGYILIESWLYFKLMENW